MEFGDVDDTALEALREYVRRTKGHVDNMVMSQVAKEFGVTMYDMNKNWHYIPLTKYEKNKI